LPAPFDGLGVLFNYTRISSDAELVNELTAQTFGLSGSSENSYNLATIYEKGRFGARLAYNYRDEYVERVSGNLGNPEFVDAYGQFDLSMNYDINDSVSLAFDAVNLTDEVIKKYAFIPERPFEYAETGRRFMIGIRMSL
jgi:TonB-dependent receptor